MVLTKSETNKIDLFLKMISHQKMYPKMMSVLVVCCTYLITEKVNISVEANSVNPDETAPTGTVLSESTLFAKEVSKTFQQKAKADDFAVIGALRGSTIILQL